MGPKNAKMIINMDGNERKGKKRRHPWNIFLLIFDFMKNVNLRLFAVRHSVNVSMYNIILCFGHYTVFPGL